MLNLQPLNYEDGSLKHVTITVENEIPYYSCKVKRWNTTGLWEVTITGDMTGASVRPVSPSTYHMTVTVEDVNEPPIIDEPNKTVKLNENVKEGQFLWKFTARDSDVASANTFV